MTTFYSQADVVKPFEFVIPRRPVSQQTKNRKNFQAWKGFVRAEAAKSWAARTLITAGPIRFSLVYLFTEAPVDTDNIIKPIQDALIGLVWSDDAVVADVDCHRRQFAETFDLSRLPSLLVESIVNAKECVYVNVMESEPLEDLI